MNRLSCRFGRLTLLSLFAAAAACWAGPAHAVTYWWDASGTGSQTDGDGAWLGTNWWDGVADQTWTPGWDAGFGSGGTGGAVTLASPTTVNSLTFNAFTGTYTLGTAGQAITLTNGITMNSGAGAVSVISPVTLGGAQSWLNNSSSLLTVGTDPVDNAGYLLTVGGSGNTTISSAIGGAGGLTKSGNGTLVLTGNNTYKGATVVSEGRLILSAANSISGATSVAATGTLQLGNAGSMGTSIMTLANGATLELRNDDNTTFTAPIATAPTTGITYNFDVNQTASGTGKTLSLGDLTFATSTSGTITNRINVTGGNNYILGLGTISAPSSTTGGPHPFIVNATTAAVTISKFSAGYWGNALTLQGGNAITLNTFEFGSNGADSLTVSGNGTVATLGSAAATGGRSGGSAGYTLTSGSTLNLTTPTSLANVYISGTASAPTFTITSERDQLRLGGNRGYPFGFAAPPPSP